MNDAPALRLPHPPLILTINGGSSNIKFAALKGGDMPRRILADGIDLEEERNTASDGAISAAAGRVAVRVIRTDEERVITETVCRVLGLGR